jgi:hypothetical protein
MSSRRSRRRCRGAPRYTRPTAPVVTALSVAATARWPRGSRLRPPTSPTAQPSATRPLTTPPHQHRHGRTRHAGVRGHFPEDGVSPPCMPKACCGASASPVFRPSLRAFPAGRMSDGCWRRSARPARATQRPSWPALPSVPTRRCGGRVVFLRFAASRSASLAERRSASEAFDAYMTFEQVGAGCAKSPARTGRDRPPRSGPELRRGTPANGARRQRTAGRGPSAVLATTDFAQPLRPSFIILRAKASRPFSSSAR